jgi:hypothetical protein
MSIPLPPDAIMRQIAEAIPEPIRANIIVVGSLAAGYYFFGSAPEEAVMTKDVDCLLSPNVRAVENSKTVAERLLNEGWKIRNFPGFNGPGNAQTPTDDLPFVRLTPPDNSEWFIELNASPPAGQKESASSASPPRAATSPSSVFASLRWPKQTRSKRPTASRSPDPK